jgi:hypothetical protein
LELARKLFAATVLGSHSATRSLGELHRLLDDGCETVDTLTEDNGIAMHIDLLPTFGPVVGDSD